MCKKYVTPLNMFNILQCKFSNCTTLHYWLLSNVKSRKKKKKLLPLLFLLILFPNLHVTLRHTLRQTQLLVAFDLFTVKNVTRHNRKRESIVVK